MVGENTGKLGNTRIVIVSFRVCSPRFDFLICAVVVFMLPQMYCFGPFCVPDLGFFGRCVPVRSGCSDSLRFSRIGFRHASFPGCFIFPLVVSDLFRFVLLVFWILLLFSICSVVHSTVDQKRGSKREQK